MLFFFNLVSNCAVYDEIKVLLNQTLSLDCLVDVRVNVYFGILLTFILLGIRQVPERLKSK